MPQENPKEKTAIERTAQDLFDYAIDREDVKWLMARWPEQGDVKATTVEYELQILKIITVGWSISYHLEDDALKEALSEIFWRVIYDFSKELSTTTGLMIGQEIDYFDILKQRLDMYVDAMALKPDAAEPAQVVGPEFARVCGNGDDIFAFMTGSKMFFSTVTRVKQYLDVIKERAHAPHRPDTP